jgi:hypothetical protein
VQLRRDLGGLGRTFGGTPTAKTTDMRLLAACVVVGLVGCSPDDPGGGMVFLPDAGAECSPQALLPDGWKAVAKVSAGAVTNEAGQGVTVSTIDASAGGFGASGNEPFVYVRFANGTLDKIAIDDSQAFASQDWDIAFKRYVIRANGGDSGAAGVTVAGVEAASLAEVSAAPDDGLFLADDWSTDACKVIVDQLGAPSTAVGAWYIANNMRLDPQARVYVIRRADGTSFKLRVLTYYGDPGDPTKSAFFRVEWAAL